MWLRIIKTFSSLVYIICFGFARTYFYFTKFHRIKVYPWKEMISFLFLIGKINIFSLLGYMILMLRFKKKSFSFHHVPCNYSLFTKRDKLGFSQLCLSFSWLGIINTFFWLGYTILKLSFRKKSFFLPFSVELKLIYQKR